MVEAILIGLAGFRMASFLVMEKGPFDIFLRLVNTVCAPGPMSKFRYFLCEMLQCIWCTSVWTTIFAVFLWFLEPWLVIMLAAMTVAMIADSFVKGSNNG